MTGHFASGRLSVPHWCRDPLEQDTRHLQAVAWLMLHGGNVRHVEVTTAREERADLAITDWLLSIPAGHDAEAAVLHADALRLRLAGTAGSYLLIVSAPRRAASHA